MLAIDTHGAGLLLWDRFWNFMDKQSAEGAPYQYIRGCYERLESAWLAKSASTTNGHREIKEDKQCQKI